MTRRRLLLVWGLLSPESVAYTYTRTIPTGLCAERTASRRLLRNIYSWGTMASSIRPMARQYAVENISPARKTQPGRIQAAHEYLDGQWFPNVSRNRDGFRDERRRNKG